MYQRHGLYAVLTIGNCIYSFFMFEITSLRTQQAHHGVEIIFHTVMDLFYQPVFFSYQVLQHFIFIRDNNVAFLFQLVLPVNQANDNSCQENSNDRNVFHQACLPQIRLL